MLLLLPEIRGWLVRLLNYKTTQIIPSNLVEGDSSLTLRTNFAVSLVPLEPMLRRFWFSWCVTFCPPATVD